MSLTTNITLLEKITDGDEISWNRFYEIYSPLIRTSGEQWHLNESECDELVQDVMVNFFKRAKTFRYDRSRGSFRSYLRTIARNSTFSLLKKRPGGQNITAGNEALMDLAFDEKWDAEWHKHLCSEALKVLQQCMEKLSYQSFYMYVIEEIPPQKVAAELGISINAVYINKSRAIEHLRQIIRQLDRL